MRAWRNFKEGNWQKQIDVENFILETIGDGDTLNLSRNELANFFNVSPSQINYVLSTRFTEPKGFLIESHRGGGGYIKLERVNLDKNNYIKQLLSTVLNDEIRYNECLTILAYLCNLKIISEDTRKVLGYALTSKALALPVRIENKQRANILKNVLINIIKE